MEAIYYIKNGKETTHLDRYPVAKDISDFDKVLLLDGALNVDIDFIPHIFRWLDVWEVAVVFHNYNLMLVDVADKHDREKIESSIYDLRVPLYRDDIIFVRNCENSKLLLACYEKEKENYNSSMVALLKAIWEIKPFILYLPKEILL